MKKFITSMLLACMMCSPMMVSAEEYTETINWGDGDYICYPRENYYFLLEEISSKLSGATIDVPTTTFNITTNNTGYYENTNFECVENDIGVFNCSREVIYSNLEYEEYHDRLFEALDSYKETGSIEYVYEYEDRDGFDHKEYYYLQNAWQGQNSYSNLPFFANSYLQLTSSNDKQEFKDKIFDSYLYIDGDDCLDCDIEADDNLTMGENGSNDEVEIGIEREYHISFTRNNTTTHEFVFNPPWLTIGDIENDIANAYSVRYVPVLYKIESFDPEECEPESGISTKYTITYNPNGGTGEVVTKKTTKGLLHTFLDNSVTKFSREGYTFIGWSTDKDATQAQYIPGKSTQPKGDMTLYAIWQNNGGGKEAADQSKNGLGYSIGIIGAILVATGAGVVYFKKRNKFENI